MRSQSKGFVRTRRNAPWLARLCVASGVFLAATSLHAGAPEAAAGEPNALAQQVEPYRGKADALARVSVFKPASAQASRDAATSGMVSSGTLLEPDAAALAQLTQRRPHSMTLVLPTRERGEVELELVAQSIFAPGFTIQASGGEDTSVLNRGLHYRGIVKGEPRSFAAISVFGHEIMGTFSTPTEGNWVVGRLQGDNASDRHIVYAESSLLLDKSLLPQCAMDSANSRKSFASYWQDEKGADEKSHATTPAAATKCVTQWFEAEYDIYQSKGSLQATTDYLTGLFNSSSTLYANDGMNMKLEKLHIWTTSDPYNGSDTSASLSSFQQNRAGDFTGTVAQLLSSRGNGGLAAGFSGICAASRSSSMAVSMGLKEYGAVPTYSYTVQVVTHEVGHLLGSRHTHACVWNGNNTAIDGCNNVEGSCQRPGVPPNGGGTIMSYCGLTAGGQKFENGFGPQPKQLIQNRIAAGSCLSENCGGGDNQPPTASFASTASGRKVDFDGSASADPDGSIASYAWDYGDNSSSGSGVRPSHTYSADGTYTVKLTVTDDDNASHTVSKSVTVSSDTGGNQAPTASFTATSNGLTASFNGSGSSDPDGSIASYAWNYGDNTSAGSGVTSSHTYASAGNYTVTLTVTDNGNPPKTGSSSKQVTVSGGGGVSCAGGSSYSGSMPSFPSWVDYKPSFSGYGAAAGIQSVCLSGPGGANFDVYLDQQQPNFQWLNVAKATGASANESLSFNGTAGTYRVRVVNVSGSGSYTVVIKKP